MIDYARRAGRRTGLYLMLGSASLDLLAQSGETPAGRVAYMELGPISARESGREAMNALWLRGGFPDSFMAAGDTRSLK